jgi:MFS family permease
MKRVIFLYGAFQLFFSLLWWLPVFYEYQKRFGLSDAEIFRIQSIYYVAFCLLELPTGTLADAIGHRRCLRAGALVLVAANLLPVFAPGYAGFLLHFLGVGLARSLISGASSAYLYGAFEREGRPAAFKQAEGSARAYGLVGKVGCWAVVGALMEWHVTLPYWLTAASAAVAVAFALRLPEVGEDRARPGVLEGLAGALAAVRASPRLVLLMVQGVAVFVLGRIIQVNLFQPILGAKSFSLASYGLVMAAMTLFEALGSARPGWLQKRLSDENAVHALTLVMAACLFAFGRGGALATVAALCAFSLAMGFSFPIQRQLLNDAIPDSRYRATILSLESIVDRAVCAVVALILGAYAGSDRLIGFLDGSALITLVAGTAVFVALRAAQGRPVAQLR